MGTAVASGVGFPERPPRPSPAATRAGRGCRVARRTATRTMTHRPPDARSPARPPGAFAGYPLGTAYDELFDRDFTPRPHYLPLFDALCELTGDEFQRRKAMTDLCMRQDGVGFTVYRAEEGIERVWPMDP